jgi:hypothetical protein
MPSPATPSAAVRDVGIDGTRFLITLADGRVLAQAELPNVVLAIGDGLGTQRRIRIDGSEPDLKDAAGEIVLYACSEQDTASGEWQTICQPDPARGCASGSSTRAPKSMPAHPGLGAFQPFGAIRRDPRRAHRIVGLEPEARRRDPERRPGCR